MKHAQKEEGGVVRVLQRSCLARQRRPTILLEERLLTQRVIPHKGAFENTQTEPQQSRSCLHLVARWYMLVLWNLDEEKYSYYRSTLNPSPFSTIKSSNKQELKEARFMWASSRAWMVLFFFSGIWRFERASGCHFIFWISSTANSAISDVLISENLCRKDRVLTPQFGGKAETKHSWTADQKVVPGHIW